jgi:hypothetical protein
MLPWYLEPSAGVYLRWKKGQPNPPWAVFQSTPFPLGRNTKLHKTRSQNVGFPKNIILGTDRLLLSNGKITNLGREIKGIAFHKMDGSQLIWDCYGQNDVLEITPDGQVGGRPNSLQVLNIEEIFQLSVEEGVADSITFPDKGKLQTFANYHNEIFFGYNSGKGAILTTPATQIWVGKSKVQPTDNTREVLLQFGANGGSFYVEKESLVFNPFLKRYMGTLKLTTTDYNEMVISFTIGPSFVWIMEPQPATVRFWLLEGTPTDGAGVLSQKQDNKVITKLVLVKNGQIQPKPLAELTYEHELLPSINLTDNGVYRLITPDRIYNIDLHGGRFSPTNEKPHDSLISNSYEIILPTDGYYGDLTKSITITPDGRFCYIATDGGRPQTIDLQTKQSYNYAFVVGRGNNLFQLKISDDHRLINFNHLIFLRPNHKPTVISLLPFC